MILCSTHRRVPRGGVRGPDPPFPGPPFSSVTPQHFTDIKGSKYMLVHSLASKYARFVVLVRLMYWTPPSDHWTPLLKSDDLFLGNQEILDPPFKNPGHAPVHLLLLS